MNTATHAHICVTHDLWLCHYVRDEAVNVSFVEMLISRECQTCCVSVQGIVVDKILWKLIPKGEIAN